MYVAPTYWRLPTQQTLMSLGSTRDLCHLVKELLSLSFWVKIWRNSIERGNRNKILPPRWTPKTGTDRALSNDESCKWSFQVPKVKLKGEGHEILKVKLKYSIKDMRIQSEDSLCFLLYNHMGLSFNSPIHY